MDSYKGVPLSELQIETLRITDEVAKHLKRSLRLKGETDIEVEWATEAVFDPRAVIRLAANADPANASLKSDRRIEIGTDRAKNHQGLDLE